MSNDADRAAVATGRLLAKKKLTISVCESCTGGMLSAAITSVPGSSRYFLGGVIAYSDAIKMSVIKVAPSVIRRSGAVSAASARAMALGVRKITGSDIGAAITGIAGPGGGSRHKPVGTVYIAMATKKKVSVRKYSFNGRRQMVRKSAIRETFALLKEMLNSL
ncbi:nicotinamide-nucleotide amidohydrolase family protein [candidate division WOR-3 bacterium]|nr:nicotinamide-nucleotide amidohydrolase family protein [candidate division WOR-3 bacterium]